MSVTTAKAKNTKHYIIVAVVACLIFLFGRIVPEFAGITHVGISVLGIFLGVLLATMITGETFGRLCLGWWGLFCAIMPAHQSCFLCGLEMQQSNRSYG